MRHASKLLVIAGVLLIGLAAGKSAYAQTLSISVTGNGSDSINNASAAQNQVTYVTQANSSTVTNEIDVNADTGHNAADNNTNGSSAISTGSVSSEILVNNAVGSNSNNSCCVGSQDPLTALISGNGSHSENSVSSSSSNTHVVNQLNHSNLQNNISGNLNTGGNSTSNNTNGSNHITTGSVFSTIGINNLLNGNSAVLSCCNINPAEPPTGGLPIPSIPAAIVQTPGQVLAASKVAVLPMTGAGDTTWIMSLASLVLLFGFVVRRSAGSLLMGMLGA